MTRVCVVRHLVADCSQNSGDVDGTRKLAESEKIDLLTAADETGQYALHVAAKLGFLPMVKCVTPLPLLCVPVVVVCRVYVSCRLVFCVRLVLCCV